MRPHKVCCYSGPPGKWYPLLMHSGSCTDHGVPDEDLPLYTLFPVFHASAFVSWAFWPLMLSVGERADMPAPRHLRYAPITEAIIDFRVKARPEFRPKAFTS